MVAGLQTWERKKHCFSNSFLSRRRTLVAEVKKKTKLFLKKETQNKTKQNKQTKTKRKSQTLFFRDKI